MDDTLAIGGIRLSNELVQVELWETGVSGNGALLDLLGRAAAAKISIAHLHQVRQSGVVQTTLCIDSGSFAGLGVSAGGGDARGCILRQGIGTLTVYPHGCDLAFVLRLLRVLAGAGIAVHGLSTSISALVVHMDYALLDAGAEAVLTVCRLPDNHSPMRPVVVLGDQEVETAAVYWEPTITIYGMQVATGLQLWQMTLRPQALASLIVSEEAPASCRFVNLFMHKTRSGTLAVFLLAATEADPSVILQQENGKGEPLRWSSIPVDLVSFHGPHFHDRYGIAQRCCQQLEHDGLQIAALGCTGTSMHIVTGTGSGKAVAQSLEKVCSVPPWR